MASMSVSSLSFARSANVQGGLRISAPAKPVAAVVRAPALKTEAMVKIRFTRLGRKRKPFYRIIAIDSRKRRDGAPLEELGWYDPMAKQSNLNAPAIKAWIAKGAQPSETVGALLKRSLIID